MPLTGEAKKAYQRVYMRQSRRVLREAAKQAQAAGVKVSGAALQAAAAVQVSQVILKEGLDRADLPLDVSLHRVRQLHDAVRPYGKDAIDGPDNDARARACEMALKLHERAGTLPVAPTEGHAGAQVQVIYQRITVLAGQAPPDVVDACDNAIEVSQTTRNHAD